MRNHLLEEIADFDEDAYNQSVEHYNLITTEFLPVDPAPFFFIAEGSSVLGSMGGGGGWALGGGAPMLFKSSAMPAGGGFISRLGGGGGADGNDALGMAAGLGWTVFV